MAEVKATTTATRNQNNSKILDEIWEMAAAAQCRDPLRRKILRKIASKTRREFDASRTALSRGKTVQRPAVTKQWVSGRAIEDRDEWAE